MPIHDSPLVLTKKHVTSKTLPKQNEELLENALILSMLKSSEQIRSLERAVQRIPSTSSESKADKRTLIINRFFTCLVYWKFETILHEVKENEFKSHRIRISYLARWIEQKKVRASTYLQTIDEFPGHLL